MSGFSLLLMGTVFTRGKTAISTKGLGKCVSNTVKAQIRWQVETVILASTATANLMEWVNTIGLMVLSISVSLRRGSNMAKASGEAIDQQSQTAMRVTM